LALAYVSGLIPGFHHNGFPPLRLHNYWSQLGLSSPELALILIAVVAMDAFPHRYLERSLLRAPVPIRWGLYYAAIVLLFFYYKTVMTFIYAQF